MVLAEDEVELLVAFNRPRDARASRVHFHILEHEHEDDVAILVRWKDRFWREADIRPDDGVRNLLIASF